MKMKIVFKPDGTVECLYTDAIDLTLLGKLTVQRASTIEYNNDWQEWVTTILATGEKFTHKSRAKALEFERWLLESRI